jgi:hypothetical protein
MKFRQNCDENHGQQPAGDNNRERFELLHHFRGLGRAVGRFQIQGDCNLFLFGLNPLRTNIDYYRTDEQ